MARILDYLKKFVGSDILLLYGPTGSLKSKFCMHVVRSVLKEGGTARFLDTERNLTPSDVQTLGKAYHYTPIWEEIMQEIQRAPKFDVQVLDSMGMPVLVQWARKNMKARGDAMLQGIALMSYGKDWCYKNDTLLIVTTQPQSEFGDADEGRIKGAQDPIGGKALFVAKEIWYSDPVVTKPDLTESVVKAQRSRIIGTGATILRLRATVNGLEVIPEKGLKFYRDGGEAPQKPVEAPPSSEPEAPAEEGPLTGRPVDEVVTPPEAPPVTYLTRDQRAAIERLSAKAGEDLPPGLDELTKDEAAKEIQRLSKIRPAKASEPPKPEAPAKPADPSPAEDLDYEINI